MRFELSDDQRTIKDTAHEFLAARSAPARVRELAEPGDYDDAAWREMCDLGWPGTALPEEHGGMGLGMVELALVAEELGYAMTPCPLVPSAAAALVISRAGSPAQQADWLPRLAAGEVRATVGLAGEHGTVAPDAVEADVVVVGDDGGATLVHADAAEVEPVAALDHTRRQGRVRTDDGEPLPGDVEAGIGAASVLIAAESVGVASRALEHSVAHARERVQYGRPIGAFQAVSHRCADMYLQTESARSLAYAAAWAADHDPGGLALAAAAAKAFAADAAWRVCASAVQVLGGVGFSWEHDVHFLLKRARANAAWLGGADEHRERVAALSALADRTAAV